MDGNIPNQNSSDLKSVIIGVGVGLVAVVLVFGLLNYFRVLSISEIFPGSLGSLPQRPIVVQETQTPPPNKTEQSAFSNLPLSPSDYLITNTTVLYTIKGKVNKFEIQTDGGKNMYKMEIISLDGRSKYTFQVPEERIVEQGQGRGISKVSEGDDVQMVVSIDLQNPTVLNYGSVYVIHGL